jgi:hypothetical protein
MEKHLEVLFNFSCSGKIDVTKIHTLAVIFFFIRSDNRKAKQVLSRGLVPVGGERMWGKGIGG